MEKAEALQKYKKFVAENPSDKEGARRSFYDTFGMDPEAEPGFARPKQQTSFQREARRRLANLQTQSAAADYRQDVANARGQFAGDLGKGAVLAGATLATGGMAAPAAIATMGGAGLVGGLVEQGAKAAAGSTGVPKSGKELAVSLGVDALMGAAGEGGGRAAGALLKMGGKKVLMPLVAKAAAKTEKGLALLEEHGIGQLNKLRDATAKAGDAYKTNVRAEMDSLMAKLGRRRTGLSPATKEAMGELAGKLEKWDGGLDGLAEIKGDLSQTAFKRAGMHFEERRALKQFAASLDKKLSEGFNKIGAGEAYSAYKETADQIHRYSAATQLAEEGLRRFTGKLGYLATGVAAGSGYGAYEGYKHGGGVGGALLGAGVGAAGATGLTLLHQKGAPWLLERMLSDRAASLLTKKAITAAMRGEMPAAKRMFERAMAQAGAQTELGPIIKDMMADENQP